MGEPPLRVAVLVDRFPVVSETFVVDQVTALLDLGHEVDVYARWRPEPDAPVHPGVLSRRLLDRTTYVDELLPEESGTWELSAYPQDGLTWIPGAAEPVRNEDRWAAALPVLERCRAAAPAATCEVLDVAAYGYQAESLSALHRLDVLASLGRAHDVLHAHFGPAGNAFRFTRLLWDAPLVVSLHGYDVGSFARAQGPGLYDRLFRSAAAVTVNSGYTRSRALALGCPASLLRTLPVGVDLSASSQTRRERRPEEPLRVLVVARLVPVKGVRHLVDAVALARRSREVALDVVGDGPLARELQQQVRDLALHDAVRFHGAQDAAQVDRHLVRTDVLVLPSVDVDGDQEAQGLVLQEAQACGVPVVATRTGGVPEGLLDGVSGLLVPPADPVALASALLELAADPQRCGRMGAAGRRFVAQRYDRRVLITRLVGLYRELTAGSRQAQVVS